MESKNKGMWSNLGNDAQRPIRRKTRRRNVGKRDSGLYRTLFAEMSQLSSGLMIDPLEDTRVLNEVLS